MHDKVSLKHALFFLFLFPSEYVYVIFFPTSYLNNMFIHWLCVGVCAFQENQGQLVSSIVFPSTAKMLANSGSCYTSKRPQLRSCMCVIVAHQGPYWEDFCADKNRLTCHRHAY